MHTCYYSRLPKVALKCQGRVWCNNAHRWADVTYHKSRQATTKPSSPFSYWRDHWVCSGCPTCSSISCRHISSTRTMNRIYPTHSSISNVTWLTFYPCLTFLPTLSYTAFVCLKWDVATVSWRVCYAVGSVWRTIHLLVRLPSTTLKQLSCNGTPADCELAGIPRPLPGQPLGVKIKKAGVVVTYVEWGQCIRAQMAVWRLAVMHCLWRLTLAAEVTPMDAWPRVTLTYIAAAND